MASDGLEPVYTRDESGVRRLHIGSDTVQSAMRIARPNDLEVPYTRAMMAFLLFKPEPRAVHMIGLGGGSLAKFVYHRVPEAQITAVEVDPRVVALARESFALPPDDERLRVIVADGVEHVARGDFRADALMVDGYDAESQVAALATLPFYRGCARRLGDDGVLVVNLWGGDSDFKACVARLRAAFAERVLCLPAGTQGNVAAFAFARGQACPRWDELHRRAEALTTRFGLPFGRFVEDFKVLNAHDAEALRI